MNQPLFPCSACQAPVSLHAEKCTRCGHPLRPGSPPYMVLLLFLVGASISIGLAYSLWSSFPK